MNVQIHPAHFRKIVSSEPFSLMLDVAAASGYTSHRVYVSLALARAARLNVSAVNVAVNAEIRRRATAMSIRTAGGAI
ncbi:hypothetical protein [Vibrio cholerae]|uniref:hypothetical protein n=1 Tax=Vibrio cholerae TaxID=666 RepID=UPI002AB50C12|nr:hypothetical protein [Vibrio cholerae]MDY7587523.1 hypothetical protein [Vibrio cholerae]